MSPAAVDAPGTFGNPPSSSPSMPKLADPNGNDWRFGLLTALGVPVNPTTLAALSFWHQSEGTPSSGYNWLAISDPHNNWPHAGMLAENGGNPIWAFPDQATGIAATASFLNHGYSNVLDAFRGADASTHGLGDIWQAINSSGWCRGCQDGEYPKVLHRAIGGGIPDPGPLAGEPGAGPAGGPVTDPAVGDRPADNSDCLIGPFTMPGPIPNIPCLFEKSWGWAILGGLSIVAGSVVILVGVVLITGRSSTARGALGTIGSAGSSAAGGLYNLTPRQRYVLREQREAEAQGSPRVRGTDAGGRGTAHLRTQEEPF